MLKGLEQDVNEKIEEVKENAETFSDNWDPNSPNANVIAKAFGDRSQNADAATRLPSGANWAPSYMGGWGGGAYQNGQPLAAEEVVEDIDLDEAVYTLADKVEAIQDWWDAYRNAENGKEPWEEENRAFEWLQEVLGDEFGTFWDKFIEQSEGKDLSGMEDIPADWYTEISGAATMMNDAVADLKTNVESNKTVANTVAGMDIKKFNGLPAELQLAAQRGTASGVSGIRVYLDGATVGRLVAPYVNQAFGALAQ